MLYLYAITEASRVPAIPGLRGAPLRAVGEEGGLFAVASQHDDLQLEPNEDDLWAHENVVEELMNGSVLPMRFGSGLADEAAVLGLLNERRQALELALERVRGAVELSVRVAIAAEPDNRDGRSQGGEETGPGTAYLLDRLQRERHENLVTTKVHERLSSLARASTSWSGEHRRRLWKAAYLVSHERLDAFTEQVDLFDAELAGAAVLCTGPWPPYSFSSRDADA